MHRRRFYTNILRQQVSASDEYLFLIGGQSNVGDAPATGRVAYNLMPSYLAATQTLVKQWITTSSTFETYTHPNATQWGFMNEMLYRWSARKNKVIYFYKLGEGGRQLASGGPYTTYSKTAFKNNSLNAINAFKTMHPTGKVVMIWCQGYTDGLNEANSLAYGTNLAAWFAEVRSHFSIANLLIAYDKLSINATGSTFRINVRDGQTTVDAQTVGGQDRNIMIESDDCPYFDVAHYSVDGAIILGQRFDTTLNSLGL